ncbi:MAG: hypothetical protein IPO43_10595 [Rhodoferax sp.]|nr:hypothetical protein [Rhodoferax sp.]
MSDAQNAGFGKFVPGFDFLQNLAKGASNSIPQMPNLANWVAPTLNVEELEKRIDELKAVHFWLEQNSKALGATIQALEVQKMTLATLKGMNFNMGDVANALKLKAADSVASGVQRVTDTAASTAKTISSVASGAGAMAKSVGKGAATKKSAGSVSALVDPLQLWGALTQQFQQIAAGAMKEAATNTAVDATKNMATGLAREAVKAAAKRRATGAKTPARKSAKKTSRG